MDKISCLICGNSVKPDSLRIHIKKSHNITEREYKVRFNLVDRKLCLFCNNDITSLRDAAKFCDSGCKNNWQIEQSHIRHPDNTDFVQCKICNLRGRDLAKHIFTVHNMSVYDYYEKYNCNSKDLRCVEFINDLSGRIMGDKNPGYQHGGRFSSLSKNFVKYTEMIDEDITDYKNKVIEKISYSNINSGNNSKTLSYWLNITNGNRIEAEKLLSEAQKTFSLDICIEKYGIEEGTRVWKERQIRWQETLANKSYEEILDINRKKGTGGSKGKISIESIKVLIPLYKYIRKLGYTKDDVHIGLGKSKEFSIQRAGTNTFYYYDLTVIPIKLIIEYNGVIWHPRVSIIGQDNFDKWRHPFKRAITAKEIQDKDLDKIECAKNNGFDIIELWSIVNSDCNIRIGKNKINECRTKKQKIYR